jgi:hypothetical protein
MHATERAEDHAVVFGKGGAKPRTAAVIRPAHTAAEYSHARCPSRRAQTAPRPTRCSLLAHRTCSLESASQPQHYQRPTSSARIATVPCARNPHTRESDTQVVAKNRLDATRSRALLSDTPVPEPNSVTLEAPVAAMFIVTTLLGEGPAADESAAVDPTARWPATPSGVFTMSELSDVHIVI